MYYRRRRGKLFCPSPPSNRGDCGRGWGQDAHGGERVDGQGGCAAGCVMVAHGGWWLVGCRAGAQGIVWCYNANMELLKFFIPICIDIPAEMSYHAMVNRELVDAE